MNHLIQQGEEIGQRAHSVVSRLERIADRLTGTYPAPQAPDGPAMPAPKNGVIDILNDHDMYTIEKLARVAALLDYVEAALNMPQEASPTAIGRAG